MRHERLARIASDPIARLRRLRGDNAAQDSEVREAFQRVFKSNDGQILLNWMIAQSYGRTVPENADDSALRANEVRKRFLDQILALAEDTSAATRSPDSQKSRRRR